MAWLACDHEKCAMSATGAAGALRLMKILGTSTRLGARSLRAMFRRIVGLVVAAPAALLLWFAAAANQAWFERHVVLPAYRLPPPPWALPALRAGSVALALLLLGCAAVAYRRATAGSVARVAAALLLSA